MSITNPGRRTLEHVEMTLTIDVPHSAFETGHIPDDLQPLPPAPDPPKPRSLATYAGFPAVGSTLLPDYLRFTPRDLYVPSMNLDIAGDSITLSLGRIRPEKPVADADFHLFLHEHPVNDELVINWALTSTSTEGIQRGSTTVPVLPRQGVFLPTALGLPEEPAPQ